MTKDLGKVKCPICNNKLKIIQERDSRVFKYSFTCDNCGHININDYNELKAKINYMLMDIGKK